MNSSLIQELCERGQAQLMEMRYLDAEASLIQAEALALEVRDWDTLSRLYLPLQEARRQKRQRCGEGTIQLDLLATSPTDQPSATQILQQTPHGQLLVAGWGTLTPAIELRKLARERGLFVETFLAAVYPIGAGRAVVIAPQDDVALPPASPPTSPRSSIDELITQLPAQCIVLNARELPAGPRRGTAETYGEVMALWERLHSPFLAAADMQAAPLPKIEAYRRTIRVDEACELAHQRLADVARSLSRSRE